MTAELTPVLEQHWSRFKAWCAAWGRDALPATPETVEEFLTLFPGSTRLQRLRRQAIAAAHSAAGESSPIVVPEPDRVWKGRATREDVEQALAEIPKYRHPVGLRGRRDAFLVVLIGYLGFSREQARRLDVDAIQLGSIVRIQGLVVPSNDDPVTCMACAVTRWLRVVGNAYRGLRHETRALLDPTKADLAAHDCGSPVREPWRVADELLLPLDTYGWARTGVPLSARSITKIIPARRGTSGFVEDVGPHTRKPSRFDGLTAAETYEATRELEVQVADAYAKSLEALAQAQRLGLEIDGLLVPMPDGDEDDEGW